MEWLRARLLTGFPWLSIGYSQTDSPLASLLPVVGETGLSALLAMCAMSLCIGVMQKRYLQALSPLVIVFVVALSLTNATWTTPTGQSKTIALVQGNIAQSLRWEPKQDEITKQKYLDLTAPHWNNDIVIWPEAAVPALESLMQTYLYQLDDLATTTNTGFITGVVSYDVDTDIAHNALMAMGIDTDRNTYPYRLNHAKRYAKHHLLPIGEFVPFEDLLRPLAPIFDLPMSSFTRGDYVQANLIASDTHFLPAICFEIAFPNQIAANITPATNAIITVSNDAWFGDSHGPHQHLQIAKARAKEFGIPVVRATNNGITAIVDHRGNTQAELPQFEAAVLSSSLTLVNGSTPYFKMGDYPLWLLSLVFFAIACFLQNQYFKRIK